MYYRVNYLASDGEIRWIGVEAESSEEAEQKAWEVDANINACGDNIMKIISVD